MNIVFVPKLCKSFTFESRVKKVKAPTQGSKSTTVIPRCIELLRMIFDRQGILFSTRINRSRREDGKKKLIRTPLPEPSTFFLRLLSPLFFSSLSTGLLSASSSLCVFTEIGEAAGCYFPVPTVWAGVQRLQILLSASWKPLSPAKHSSPSFLSSPLIEEGSGGVQQWGIEGHSKKGGVARGSMMIFRPNRLLPPANS